MDGNSVLPPTRASSSHRNEAPLSRNHTRQSSVSSESSRDSISSAQQAILPAIIADTIQPPILTFTQPYVPKTNPPYPVDALARSFPKPTEELDVKEALSRKPGRWTLAHYIKETPVRDPEEVREQDREKIARDMEAKKQELLRAREEIQKMALPK